MANSKRYTLAYKKRVDHQQPQPPAPEREPAVCGVCGAVYINKHWTLPQDLAEPAESQAFEPMLTTTCPACLKKKEQLPGGLLYVRGEFLKDHLEEVEACIRGEADRAAHKNPTARIMKWDREPDGSLSISTTTERLAQRLGRALKKAFAGEVRYDFSHENKLARVYWERD